MPVSTAALPLLQLLLITSALLAVPRIATVVRLLMSARSAFLDSTISILPAFLSAPLHTPIMAHIVYP